MELFLFCMDLFKTDNDDIINLLFKKEITMDKITSTQSTIKNYLLTNHKFEIPGFQRNYSWDENNILDLVDDLFSILESSDRDVHFFGQIITYSEDNKIEIIDGQQRITTVFIFLAVIKSLYEDVRKELLKNESDNIKISQLDRRIQDLDNYIIVDDDDFSEENKQLKLTLQEDFHGNIPQKSLESIFGISEIDEKNKNHITKNFAYMKNVINKKLKEEAYTNKFSVLKKISDILLDKFVIVSIEAEDRGNAFIMFQTINVRGKGLTSADIIKSHIVSIDNSKDNQFLKEWSDIYTTFGQDDNDDAIASFVRDYVWSSISSPKDSELYKVISKNVTDQNSAESFLEDLMGLKDLYKCLITDGNNSFISGIRKQYEQQYGKNNNEVNEIVDILYSLHRMMIKIHFPIVMSMFNNQFGLLKTLHILNKVYSIIMRNNIIGGAPNNVLSKKISAVSVYICNAKSVDDLDEEKIIDKFKDISKDDKYVHDMFINLKKKGGKQGRTYGILSFLLYSMYECLGMLTDKDNSYYFNDFKDNNYKLVHLTVDDREENEDDNGYVGEWTYVELSILKDVKFDYQNTMSIDKENRIEILKRSDVPANKELAKMIEKNDNTWTIKDVEERQELFANTSVEVWRSL